MLDLGGLAAVVWHILINCFFFTLLGKNTPGEQEAMRVFKIEQNHISELLSTSLDK